MRTVGDTLLALEDDHDRGVHHEDSFVSWSVHVRESRRRAALLEQLLPPGRPRHFGVLLDNVPEFSLLAGAAALSGTVLVGLNTTRRGPALARDIAISDCAVVFTDSAHRALLDGADALPDGADALPDGADTSTRVVDIDGDEWKLLLESASAEYVARDSSPEDLFMLIFTSGTSGHPKAVRCTHEKICGPGRMLAERFELSTDDVVYLAMPMFHSNSMMASWSVALAAGCSLVLRSRFSASGFLPDVRRYGVTYANYVGKPLSFVLATPPAGDDADNPLRIMYGNEGSATAVAEFARRFGTRVIDGFGSTEGGIAIPSTPDAPAGALGRLPDGIEILSPDTGKVCAVAEFDDSGRLRNAAAATGELVNVAGSGAFAGYYADPAADAERIRDGKYWSGDLAYRDTDGFVYFAGRSSGWLRVDGENLGSAPIERILLRWSGLRQVCVYGVPDPDVGDRVMAALVPSTDFDPEAFARFLGEQPDLGPTQTPSLVRVCASLPRTATFKVLARTLAAQRWDCADPVWYRPRGASGFRLVEPGRTPD